MSNQINSYETYRLKKFVKDFLTCLVSCRNYNTNLGGQQRLQNQPNSFSNEFNSTRYDQPQEMNWRQNHRPVENQNNFSSMNYNWDNCSGSQEVSNNQYEGNAYNYTENNKLGKLENPPHMQQKFKQFHPSNISTGNECNNTQNTNLGKFENTPYMPKNFRQQQPSQITTGNAYNNTKNTQLGKLENTSHIPKDFKRKQPSKITTGNAYNTINDTQLDKLENTSYTQKKFKQQQSSKITTDIQKRKQTVESGKQNRISLTPYKNREFANAKRSIQRLGKLDYDTLEEKQRLRLDRAREIMAIHKKAGNRKYNPNAINANTTKLI